MRDILEDMFGGEPVDPTESARRSMRAPLRKRFYERASAGEGPAYPVLLDGRAIKTPAKNTLAAPVRSLAEAIAAEWDAQVDHVDPRHHAADAARQQHHRRRRDAARSDRRGDREVSRLGLALLSRRYAGRARRQAGGALGPDPWLGAQ